MKIKESSNSMKIKQHPLLLFSLLIFFFFFLFFFFFFVFLPFSFLKPSHTRLYPTLTRYTILLFLLSVEQKRSSATRSSGDDKMIGVLRLVIRPARTCRSLKMMTPLLCKFLGVGRMVLGWGSGRALGCAGWWSAVMIGDVRWKTVWLFWVVLGWGFFGILGIKRWRAGVSLCFCRALLIARALELIIFWYVWLRSAEVRCGSKSSGKRYGGSFDRVSVGRSCGGGRRETGFSLWWFSCSTTTTARVKMPLARSLINGVSLLDLFTALAVSFGISRGWVVSGSGVLADNRDGCWSDVSWFQFVDLHVAKRTKWIWWLLVLSMEYRGERWEGVDHFGGCTIMME